ncbi:hypothetical protein J113_04415 [Mycobacterium tuberculosis CAS/NITR204]|uniref:Galactokinase n=1 Tax=Mycobacterium tuberculosis CAS/NITR204 TaxID=1310114 RepID=R4MDS1_MYCTX|nr:hypothetical protein J113_04415 [Mycobacterium tuberculosis CAS/NITR204]
MTGGGFGGAVIALVPADRARDWRHGATGGGHRRLRRAGGEPDLCRARRGRVPLSGLAKRHVHSEQIGAGPPLPLTSKPNTGYETAAAVDLVSGA